MLLQQCKQSYPVRVYCFSGSFRNPIFRSLLTISGVQVMVINILNGANTLWQAYATTNVLASVATLESVTFELRPIFWRAAWTSIPLDQEKQTSKQNNVNLVKK